VRNHPQVRKRKGHREPFSPGKILHAVHRAGGSITLAAEIAAELERWAEAEHKRGRPVNAHEIHGHIVKWLRKKAPGVAREFERGAVVKRAVRFIRASEGRVKRAAVRKKKTRRR
jgi:2-phosphoglycerate kinase